MKQRVYSAHTLGLAIKQQRKLLQLNQTQAGERFCLEQSTVSSIERGTPGTRVDTLFRLLSALDLELIVQSKTNA